MLSEAKSTIGGLTKKLFVILFILFVSSSFLFSAVPGQINYQGKVTDTSGNPHNGVGYFKFVITNSAGNVSYWSNDGSSSGGNEPTNSTNTIVTNGIFNIPLGKNMTEIPRTLFDTYNDTYLKAWFSDDGITFEELTPMQKLVSVGYSCKSEYSDYTYTVVGATITSANLANDSASLSKVTDGVMKVVGGNKIGIGASNPMFLFTLRSYIPYPWIDIDPTFAGAHRWIIGIGIEDSNKLFQIYDCSSTPAAVRLSIDENGDVYPGGNKTQSLGTASRAWNNVHCSTIVTHSLVDIDKNEAVNTLKNISINDKSTYGRAYIPEKRYVQKVNFRDEIIDKEIVEYAGTNINDVLSMLIKTNQDLIKRVETLEAEIQELKK